MADFIWNKRPDPRYHINRSFSFGLHIALPPFVFLHFFDLVQIVLWPQESGRTAPICRAHTLHVIEDGNLIGQLRLLTSGGIERNDVDIWASLVRPCLANCGVEIQRVVVVVIKVVLLKVEKET